jgi:hypothetical protein
MQKPIPPQLQRAISDGTFDKISRALSAAYLLMSIAVKYMDNATDALELYGLLTHTLKREFKATDFHFDRFHSAFFKMVKADRKENDFNGDYDKLVKMIEQFIEKI